MKHSIYLIGIILISLTSCKNLDIQQGSQAEIAEIDPFPTVSDLNEIEALIREMYIWHESNNPSDIEMITEDSLFTGFNLDDLATNLEELRESGFFTENFIQNYDALHREMNEKLNNREILFHVGELPPFGGADPWCECQDVPYDEPNPWTLIEIVKIKLTENAGEFYWKWGNLGENPGSGWAAFKYHFTVKKVDGSWKIDSMEGINSMFD